MLRFSPVFFLGGGSLYRYVVPEEVLLNSLFNKCIPPEAEAVVRDTVRPRTSCEEGASLSSKFLKRGFGLDSPIKPPRASHELKRGRPIESVIESSSPYGSVDPTIANDLFPDVRREGDVKPA